MRKSFLVPAIVVLAAVGTHVRAQNAGKSVEDGVYSDVQAMRGAAAYDQSCGRCHRQDLGGADGPALKDDRFNRNFAGKDLKTLYTRMSTTMPRGAPASMSEAAYLDILAYVLRENGFPAGTAELSVDALDGVEVLPTRPKPLPAISDFSYVEVVGCLVPGSDGAWMLSSASDPVAAAAPGGPQNVAGRTSATTPTALGSQTYHLLDAMAYTPESLKGQKIYVRGLLIRLPAEQRMTISDLRSLSSTCP
jgi:S-disulfanyl-L-cysteine oxidoreductase SoxD